jgi:hypothetical protein
MEGPVPVHTCEAALEALEASKAGEVRRKLRERL